MTDMTLSSRTTSPCGTSPTPSGAGQLIRNLWQEDASHLARTLEAIGHAGIETRVADAYEKWVKEKGNVFRLRDGVDGHHGTVKLRWEMLPAVGRRGDLDRLRLPGAGRRRPHPHRLPVH